MRKALNKWLKKRELPEINAEEAQGLCSKLGLEGDKYDSCLALVWQMEKGDVTEPEFLAGLSVIAGKEAEEVAGILRGKQIGKQLGAPAILGTSEQIKAIKSLIRRCEEDIPENALNGLTISFDIPEEFKREKEPAMYGSEEKTIWLRPESTEWDFYHELSHYLDDVMGKGIHRESEADKFMRKWGVARKRIIEQRGMQSGDVGGLWGEI